MEPKARNGKVVQKLIFAAVAAIAYAVYYFLIPEDSEYFEDFDEDDDDFDELDDLEGDE